VTFGTKHCTLVSAHAPTTSDVNASLQTDHPRTRVWPHPRTSSAATTHHCTSRTAPHVTAQLHLLRSNGADQFTKRRQDNHRLDAKPTLVPSTCGRSRPTRFGAAPRRRAGEGGRRAAGKRRGGEQPEGRTTYCDGRMRTVQCCCTLRSTCCVARRALIGRSGSSGTL